MPQPQPSQIPGSSGISYITKGLKAPPGHSALLPSLCSATNCSSDYSYPHILPSQLPSQDLAAQVDMICSPFISQHLQHQPEGRGDGGKQTPNCIHAKSVGSPCVSRDCLWHSQGRQPKETKQQHCAALCSPVLTRHNQQVVHPLLWGVFGPLVWPHPALSSASTCQSRELSTHSSPFPPQLWHSPTGRVKGPGPPAFFSHAPPIAASACSSGESFPLHGAIPHIHHSLPPAPIFFPSPSHLHLFPIIFQSPVLCIPVPPDSNTPR